MSKLTIEVGAKISGLVNNLKSGVSAVGKFASGVKSAMGSVAGQLLGALSVAGIAAFVKSVVAAGDEIDKGRQRIQVTAEEYQKLSRAAEIAGSNIGTVEKAFKTVTNVIDDAGRGLKEAKDALARLGFTFDDLKDKTSIERFSAIAKALKEITNEGDRAALANDLFGKGGQELMPLINSYDGLKDSVSTMSEEAVKASAELVDAITRTKAALTNLAADSGLITYLREIAEGIDAIANRTQKLKDLGATQKGGGLFGAMGEALGDQVFGWKPEGQELTMASGAAPRDVAAAKKKKADDEAAAASRAQVREQAAIQQEMEKQIAAAEKVGKEQMRADASVAASLKDMEDKVRWQRMINDGKEREVEIEKALADATEKAKRPLTEQEAAGITSAASQLYDLTAKDKAVKPIGFESADITDAVRRIGGNLGGQGPASGETKQINLLTDIRGDIKELVSKTPEPTAKNARAVWPS